MAGRRTKIVCTLGPASSSEAAIEALIQAGMNVARINFSHGAHDEHAAIVHAVSDGDRDGLLAAVRAHIATSMEHTAWLLDRAAQANGARSERATDATPPLTDHVRAVAPR